MRIKLHMLSTILLLQSEDVQRAYLLRPCGASVRQSGLSLQLRDGEVHGVQRPEHVRARRINRSVPGEELQRAVVEQHIEVLVRWERLCVRRADK